MSELSRHRYSLILGIVVCIGFICVGNGARRVGKPFPGFLLSEGRVVVSIGRSAWMAERWERILWAQVVAVDGVPVTSTKNIEAAIARTEPGTPITYRFYKHSEVFNLPIEVRRFSLSDFRALYATYFLVGLTFAIAGWFPTQRRSPASSGILPFFAFCQVVALVLFLGGDVYGPHWFTGLYFLFHCFLPAALWHLTITYPEPLLPEWSRRVSVALAYLSNAILAWGILQVQNEPSWLLPLMYTTYLLLANTLVLFLGRLTIAWRTSDDAGRRASLRWSLLGGALSAALPTSVFVFYPAMDRNIPPALLVGPLAFFPVLTAYGMRALPALNPNPAPSSIRRRLSLLFLGAVETAYVAGVGVFWMSSTWEQLSAEQQLAYRQLVLASKLRESPVLTEANLEVAEVSVTSNEEAALLASLRNALDLGNRGSQQEILANLRALHEAQARSLEQRLAGLGTLDEFFFVLLILLGTTQAVGFMLVIRRWLVQPVAQLAEATQVIATGDLSHRVKVDASEEFTALGDAINSMAESLAAIQARVEREREARHLAAATARDAERRRLGRELHDGVLQDLGAIKLSLESLERTSNQRPDLAAAIRALIAVIVGLRRVVDDIAAPDLARESLVHAIASYSQMATTGHGVELDLALDPDAWVEEWATRDVYRIAQEAITNAIRHGAPTRLRVALQRFGKGDTILEVEDDGGGFDLGRAAMGAGLPGMRERAAAIGADVEVRSEPGRGTLIRLYLPKALPTAITAQPATQGH